MIFETDRVLVRVTAITLGRFRSTCPYAEPENGRLPGSKSPRHFLRVHEFTDAIGVVLGYRLSKGLAIAKRVRKG
jgi:hypothetical protein